MAHYVYILKSLKAGRYYISESKDVQGRLEYHNAGLQQSTKRRIPFKIVLIEEYQTSEEVLAGEKQIKSWKGGEAFKRFVGGA